MPTVKAIHIHPIKSLGAISCDSATAESYGFQNDRKWMLIDSENKFLTQRKFAQMCLFSQSIVDDQLIVQYREEQIEIPVALKEGALTDCDIWGHRAPAFEVDPRISEWFSHHLGMKCKLVRLNDAHQRMSGENDLQMNLSDGYPFLFLGSASMELLNSKLESAVLYNRFRPNIFLETSEAHEEDGYTKFQLGEASFEGSHPCARCVVTTINHLTGEKGKEPLRTMSTYRKVGERVNFGMNVFCREPGVVRVNDEISFS